MESFQQPSSASATVQNGVELNQDLKNLWSAVKTLLKAKVHTTTYETIFSQLEILSFSDGSLTLVCPSETVKQWVEKKYYKVLIDALKDYFPNFKEIAFVILDDSERIEQFSLFKDIEKSINTNEIPFPRHTFGTFVVGESNEFAYAASLAVAEEPGGVYNPLFIYGGVGLGKTHLLHAIANYVYKNHKNTRVKYVTAEKFTNEFIDAVREKTINYFHKKYREVDVLLIDDIQFIQGKEQTQEEFFHTFNTLYEAGKQVVISSDRPPRNLSALEDRMVSRFEHGLIADIHPPNLETRLAILMKKAELKNFALSNDTALAIAERVTTNIRELEGALNRVIAWCSLNKEMPSREVVEKILAETFPKRARKPVTINKIQNAVCSYFNVSKSDLIGSKRSSSISYARQIAIYLARTLTDESLPSIGKHFGGRDHSTVFYACEKISELMKKERRVLDHINTLTKIIQEQS
ncbi:MAG: chromosomal replication initiator protein DnaA [Actinobacteria bacterium]|nr:chromosomal replication initiator protein DnaA [Actinomycetota bacterium]